MTCTCHIAKCTKYRTINLPPTPKIGVVQLSPGSGYQASCQRAEAHGSYRVVPAEPRVIKEHPFTTDALGLRFAFKQTGVAG